MTCPGCGASMIAKEVREYATKVQVSADASTPCSISTTGSAPTVRQRLDEIERAERLATALLDELEETPDGTSPLPDEDMIKSQYRRYGNLVYGIDTLRGLFNDRQLYVLGTLCEAVRAAHDADAGGGR